LLGAERGERQTAPIDLRGRYVGMNVEVFAGAAQPSLAPVFTSSKIKSAPYFVASREGPAGSRAAACKADVHEDGSIISQRSHRDFL